MHDQARVREGHRAQDVEEQLQLLAQVEPLGAAVLVRGDAVDVFEREIGTPVFVDAGVVEPRDVRVLEAGENLALARDALLDAAIHQAQVRQLERHLALDGAVDALGQPHGRCPAAAELAQQAIRSHFRTSAERDGDGRGTELRQAVQEFVGLDAGAGRQQFSQRFAQVGVLGGQPVEPRRAFAGRKVQRLVQQRTQSFPVGGEGGHEDSRSRPELTDAKRRPKRTFSAAWRPAAAALFPSRGARCDRSLPARPRFPPRSCRRNSAFRPPAPAADPRPAAPPWLRGSG